MSYLKYLVTGATGKTGAAVVARLLQQGASVRAVVHRHDMRSDRLERLGAEVFQADLFDVLQLKAAMQGTQRAYYCPPFHPFAIQSGTAFALAATESKLEVVVGLSQWLASPDHPSLHTRHLWMIDQLFQKIPGTVYVNINPGYFADNYLRLMDFATLLGVFPVLTGHSLNAPPANEDIARVVVAAMTEPDRHAGKRYRPTGPALLSAFDMAGIIQRVIGRRVTPVNLPWWMFERAARIQRVSRFEIGNFRHYVEDHRQGAFERGAPTQHVYELTGSPAEDFETTVRRYAALPFTQRTVRNQLRAFVNFNRVPFSPGYRLSHLGQDQQHPAPVNMRSAMDNESWKQAHGQSTEAPTPQDELPGPMRQIRPIALRQQAVS